MPGTWLINSEKEKITDMKKIYLTLLVVIAAFSLKASPDIYTPTLSAPANNATGIAPNINLDWSPVTGQLGLYYEIQLDTVADFSNPVLLTTDLSSYRLSELLFNQKYFWRVRAVDPTATSEWSEVRNFTVIALVTIKKPDMDEDDVDPNEKITWTEIPGVAYFDVQLDTVNTFDSEAVHVITVSNLTTLAKEVNTSSLLFGQKYYYRMRARHAIDTSDWSETRAFTVLNTLVLKNPANNLSNVSIYPQFEWTRINGVNRFQIRISQDPEVEQYEAYNVLATANKANPDTLMFGTTYYWQLAAIHNADTLLSDIRSFTTLDNITLASPSNNSTNNALQPILTWQKITGVTGYELHIDHVSDFSNGYKYALGDVGEFKVPIHVLDSAMVYYWRVRAISSRDTSGYSNIWSFRTLALGMEDGVQAKNAISIYPSPAVNKVNVSIRSTYTGKATIEIHDLLGSKRMTTEASFIRGVVKDLPLNGLNNGIYMISIIADGKRTTTKLIIQK